jgi:hypothetical protein
VIPSIAKASAAGKSPTRRASNRHRKQAKVGKFAESALKHDISRRGDGVCVAGKWITEKFDEEDLKEFVRLANGHQWTIIERLSDNGLKEGAMTRHVHGTCACIDDVAGKACCDCDKTRKEA